MTILQIHDPTFWKGFGTGVLFLALLRWIGAAILPGND